MKILPIAAQDDDPKALAERINVHIVRALEHMDGWDIDPATILPAAWGFGVPSVLYYSTGATRIIVIEYPDGRGGVLAYRINQTWENGRLKRSEWLDPSGDSLGAVNILWEFHVYRWDPVTVKYEKP